jgi:hypothetical protein
LALSALVTVSVLLFLGGASPATADDANPPSVPKAQCGPGSNPESGLQGRVPRAEIDSGRAAEGYTCNSQLLGRSGPPNYQGGAGGFKVFRYVDAAGHECAYYDTTLLYPGNVSAGQVPGVWVLDMTNPSQPVRTATLLTQAMLSPHESLVLSKRRGLLAAVYGTPATAPGQVDIYDLTADCRSPVLRSSVPVGVLGHEGAMAPDGNTYYIASLDAGTLAAIDISNPDAPVPVWISNNKWASHGLSISEDGNRAYLAHRNRTGDPIVAGLVILDVSQVQARVLNPTVTEISRLSWQPIESTPQATIPVTIQGHPYLIEFDEFSDGDDNAGAARIIDIANETQPEVISNIRLEVHRKQNRASLLGDYGAGASDTTGFMGYNAHYCEVPQRNEPTVVACTFILSGMRLFDIRDPFHPTEIAYFNGPILPDNLAPGFDPAAYAMSAPAFVPARKEIWYSDGNSGFYSVRITNDVWPLPEPGGALAFASGVALLAALRFRSSNRIRIQLDATN